MKLLIRLGLVLICIVVLYFVGPRAHFDPLESPLVEPLNITLDSLDAYVKSHDLQVPNLKADNESRIIWADSVRKTRYSIVYLHGFSASPMESNPVHLEFAKQFGFNIYLPLLPGHGRDDKESFLELTPSELIAASKEAVAIGQLIGEDVIVMSCSTGSTLSIYLAGANREMIDALIMYSPNIMLENPTAKLITRPWGQQILKMVSGDYRGGGEDRATGDALKYWTNTYRSEGLIALQALLDQTMTAEVFNQVEQPYFIGYYYKNEEEKDPTISTEAILWFDENTRTPLSLKEVMPFPNAGAHVIANPLKSQASDDVLAATVGYAERVLKLKPKTLLLEEQP